LNLLRFLLTGNGLFLALAGAGIGSCTLTPERKALAVPQAPVTAYVHKALNIEGNLRTEAAFDLIIGLKDSPEFVEFFLRKIVDLPHGIDFGLDANLVGAGLADAVDIGQGYVHMLIREVNPH
jgi:hypothetical protein